jgi:uncharacterized protein YkwD
MTMDLGGITALAHRRALALLATATLAALALFAAGPGAPEAMAAKCANAQATIDEASVKQLRKALVCLINDKRRDRNRRKLDDNGKLTKAAKRHNNTMLRKDCWRHKCKGEPRLERRIRKTGYLDGATRWFYAENFGCAPTPRRMLRAWMRSTFHKNNILNRRYKDVGAAAAKELVPSSPCEGDRVTYTVVFAGRRG